MVFLRIFLITTMLLSGCSKSPEDEYSSKILEIQEALNSEDYSRAIELVETLPADRREVIKLKSMAYAGRAGFNALKIADLIYHSKDKSPVVLVYELADEYYTPSAIGDVNKAIDNIRLFYPEVDRRPQDINAIFGLAQLYKASQIILKNVKNQEIDKCEIVDFLVDDVIDLIYSINSALISLEKDIQMIRQKTQELRLQLNIPAQENYKQEEVTSVKQKLQEVVYEEIAECGPASLSSTP
jgi:hypothetical protein